MAASTATILIISSSSSTTSTPHSRILFSSKALPSSPTSPHRLLNFNTGAGAARNINININARKYVAVLFATGDAAPAETSDTPEIVKTIQQAWEKVEDKYAVGSLTLAAVVALWASAGMISAIDRLPLIPGVLELVGILYTGWFAYQNLVNEPDREALIQKINDKYKDITGSS